MTAPAQRERDVPSARKVVSVVRPAGGGADVVGHGVLVKFHSGCRCPWCSSRARESTCGCKPCNSVRASAYITLPPGWRT